MIVRCHGLAHLQLTTFAPWSEATLSATHLFKRSYKISHPPWLWASPDALPSFAALLKSAKIGLSKQIFYVKNHPNLSDFFFQWMRLQSCAKHPRTSIIGEAGLFCKTFWMNGSPKVLLPTLMTQLEVVDWFRKDSFILSTPWLFPNKKCTKRSYFCLFCIFFYLLSCLGKQRFYVKRFWNKNLGCNLILLSSLIWCKPQKLCLSYNYLYFYSAGFR